MSTSPGRLAMPRRRGAASGLLIVILGAVGILMPIVGPSLGLEAGAEGRFDGARIILQYLPGVVAVVGGLELMRTANRATGILGAQMAIAAGAWFVVGESVSRLWNSGDPTIGPPAGGTVAATLAELLSFSATGGLLLLFGGIAFARVSARLEGDRERLTTAAVATERTASSTREREKESQRARGAATPPPRERATGTGPTPGSGTTPGTGTGTGTTPAPERGTSEPRRQDPPPPEPGTRV